MPIMAEQSLPETEAPLSAVEFWRESIEAWHEFGTRSTQFWLDRWTKPDAAGFAENADDPESESATAELLRSMSDLNLRHWQNTARFLEGLPAWMQVPHVMTGSVLTDRFDQMRRAKASPAKPKKTKPAAPKKAAPQDEAPSLTPELLTRPDGTPDDLTRIKGIGPKLSGKLNEMGVFHFRQIASWSDDQVEWVDQGVSGKGRVAREQWVSQARKFAANGSARA